MSRQTARPDDVEEVPTVFRATVHGLVFSERQRALEAVRPGDALVLMPDPPGGDEDCVWVHRESGDILGHLPPDIGAWLGPWIRAGGAASAMTLKVGSAQVPSWKRLIVEVRCAA
jgi:hypothetical protein